LSNSEFLPGREKNFGAAEALIMGVFLLEGRGEVRAGLDNDLLKK